MSEDYCFHNLDETTLDHLMEGFQLIGQDWRYLFLNRAAVKHSKYSSKKDLLGSTMMEKYPGIEKTELFRALQKAMNDRVPQDIENEFVFPDNSKTCFELRIRPVPKGIFILSMDITARKKTERAREMHLLAMEEIMFLISNKIRQPVTNIIGLSGLLKDSVLSQEELESVMRYMKESIQSLDYFTKELAVFINDLNHDRRKER